MSRVGGLEGIWRVIAYEEDGVPRADDAVQTMARLLVLADNQGTEADGTWGCVSYFEPPTLEIVELSIRSLKSLVNGRDYARSASLHVYTGGLLSLGMGDSIDFLVYHGPQLQSLGMEQSLQRGIYRYDGTHLTLCLAASKIKQRPTAFDSTQTANQSLAVYVRDQKLRV